MVFIIFIYLQTTIFKRLLIDRYMLLMKIIIFPNMLLFCQLSHRFSLLIKSLINFED